MEPQEVDTIIRQLVAIAAHQDALYEALFEYIRGVQECTRQQVAINADVRTTLVRIETLLARMLPSTENGREA